MHRRKLTWEGVSGTCALRKQQTSGRWRLSFVLMEGDTGMRRSREEREHSPFEELRALQRTGVG